MRQTFLAAALAVAACVGFTTPAGAQPPARVETPDPPPVVRRVSDLERRVAALEKLAAVSFPAAKAGPCGCPLTACDCGPACPCPVAATLPVAVRAAADHTHTCPRCATTWDHSTNPGHNCPRCGTFQNQQDPAPRPVAYTLGTGGSVYSAGSGCANGACAAPVRSTRGPGIFGGPGLLNRR